MRPCLSCRIQLHANSLGLYHWTYYPSHSVLVPAAETFYLFAKRIAFMRLDPCNVICGRNIPSPVINDPVYTPGHIRVLKAMGIGGSNAIIITTAISLGISLVAVSLRCFARLKIVKSFGFDDALMVAAAAFNTAFAICGIVGASYGMGKTPAYLSHRPDDVRRGLLCWWLGQIFYVITCTIARLSIATTFLRLTVERIYSWILYGIMVISTAVGTVFLFFSIFQCRPVAYYWNRLSSEGRCLDINTLLGIVYMYSGVAATCDFTIGFLPIFMVWRLQMDRGTKFAVSAILGLACIASIAVIIRIPFLHYAGRTDFLYETTQISIWSNVEASLGITAGSLMTVRPLLRALVTYCPMLRSWGGGDDLGPRWEYQSHPSHCESSAN